MEDADGPSWSADQSSQDDDSAPKEYQHNYAKLRTHLQAFLPYLERVILPDHVAKLQYLHNMMTIKSLSTDRVENCKNVFYELYNKYSHQLNYCLPPDFKTSWSQETKLNDGEKDVSSDVSCTSYKSNQNQSSESELPNKIPISEDLNIINKEVENVKIEKSYCSKNAINGSILATNDLPEFLDSRLRLNKIIGHATNASIEKHLVSDASILHTELPTLIFDEEVKPKNGPVIPKDMLKGVNMINIDINHIKDVFDGIKQTSCVEPVQPSPLPHLMNLGASRINSISTNEPNSSKVTHDSILLSKSSTSISAQLNTHRNKLHNTGSPNESRQQFISALKPGTLIDLENSKVICGSLHLKPLRSVIKSDEKNTDLKPSFADIGIPCDPKARHKSLSSSENNVSSFNTLSSLISNGQNTIPTPFPPNTDNSNPKLLETRAQKMSVYSGQSSSSHTNIQLVNPQVSSEYYGSSIKCNNRQLSQNQNKHDLNIDKKNDNCQFRNRTQMHVNPFHTEPGTKYCDPMPHKSHSNDASKKDSRTLNSVKTIQYSNYKEYREAKYREQNKGFEINKNQMNQVQDKYRSLVNKKIEKNNIISSPYNSFGPVNETANIRLFKIPKIKNYEKLNDNSSVKDSKLKTFEDHINGTAFVKTDQKSKLHFKSDTIKEQRSVDGQKKPVLKKSNKFIKDLKMTEKVNNSHTNKDLKIAKPKKSKTDRDLKIKNIMNYKSRKNYSCPEITFEETTINIPNKVIKDEQASKSKRISMLIDHIDQKKSKEQKEYSKKNKFEKIIKDAECLNNDISGPSRKTRSSVRQKEILENLKPKFEIDITTKNDKKLGSSEYIQNKDSVSIPVLADVSGRNVIRHNIISSPPKEKLRVVNSTATEFSCKSQEKNIVPSSEINSTANCHLKVDNKVLIDLLKNSTFMNMISIFQDEEKMKKLNKLLEGTDVNTNDDKLKQKYTLNKEQLKIEEKKMENKKRKWKNTKEKVNVESLKKFNEDGKNEYLNCISDDTNVNLAENIVKTKKKKKHLNELNKGYTSFGNIYGHSSNDQHKLKSNESYGNFEILKDKSIFEEKQLKIVISKLDRNIEGRENCNADTSTNDNTQINKKPINVKIAQEIKSKKPFVGPLSVKLARQKMEMELSESRNERNIKNQLEFETKKVIKRSKSVDRFDKKEKLNSETLTSLMKNQPIVLIHPFQIPKSHENETNSSKSVEQSCNSSTYIVNKPEFKKARLSELDKLHADINGMFDFKALLSASSMRKCRINKKIDYVNTNVVLLKEKDTSIIEELDSNENQNKIISKVGKPKNTQKKVQKSTIINKKEQIVKKSTTNKTGKVVGKTVVKPIVLNKISNKKLKKKGNKKIKKCNKKFKCDEIELNNVLENEISTKIMPKIVTKDIFKDKLYFQTSKNSLKCKFCNYTDKGLNIVRHYKYQHCGKEILPSRLPENCTKSLIHQSLKENFQENSQISKLICHRSVNVNYTCVFCQFVFHDYFKFYDHITGHTGEYRYKCKMCKKIYSNEDDLENHILEHTDYDKTDGISCLVFPNPIYGKYVFGYLCSFCYYVQLDYNNIVKHMESQHFDEDRKLNGHWTVVRISMSMAGKIHTKCSIDFDNLVGCLPPIQSDQVISKSKDNDVDLQLSVTDLNVLSNEQKQPDSFFFNEKKCSQQTIEKMSQKSIIDESTSGSSFSHMNPPVSIYDKILPEVNTLKFLPEQANQYPTKETRISTERPENQYSEYTLKEKSKKCVLAGLSCELINSMLLFKCSVSNCLEKFSTVVLVDFSKHIIKNHQFVIWDGNCELCHHKLPIISEQYYVRNALAHLISDHLVLKIAEKHPNTKANLEGSKIEGLSSFCQDTVKIIPFVKNLRVRYLPGDTLSVYQPKGSSVANVCDMSVCKSESDDTNSISEIVYTIVNLNVNHGSNDKKLPISNSQIFDFKSLKKRNENTSIINSNASKNDDLNMFMKSKPNSEVVVSSSEVFLEAGQHIVNNGVPIDGKICLIDTSYTKDYMRKVQDFPMNVIKTRSAFNEMSALPRLLGLFKCMDRNCTKMFSSKELFKLHMAIHFSNAEKKKRIQIYNVQQFKMCAYCFKEFDDEESLADHIAEKYTFCEYFCPYCFYCAYTSSHVSVHQSLVHTNISKHRIIKSQYDEVCKHPKELLLVVDFNEFVLPYKCNVGCCGFSCYLHNEYVEHLNQVHEQCDRFYCDICADKGDVFLAHHSTSMIIHFRIHNFNKYQCIFCLFGSQNIDSMIQHLACEHFEYELLCLKRSTVSDNCDTKNIKNLKILRLEKVTGNGIVEIVNLPAETFSEPEILPRQSQKRFIECPDVSSIAMKSARFDEGSQPPDAIVITVPDAVQMAESSTSESLPLNNEFIMIDDDDDDDDDDFNMVITRVWSKYNDPENKSEVSSNDDIIVSDDKDDDVDLSEKEKLNKDLTKQICSKIEESINESNNIKRLTYPIIELDKLFVCKKCEIVFSNGEKYCAHLKVCPFWDYVAGRRCMYCVKIYSTPTNMTEHIKLHGPDRFHCYVCNLKVPSQRAIRLHMKNIHKIININFVPDHPNFTDLSKDHFTVFKDNTVKIKKNQHLTCEKCPYKGTASRMITHMMHYHNSEQNVDYKHNLFKIKQEKPNDSNNSVNSLMPQQNEQQNTRLKIKHSNIDLTLMPPTCRGIPIESTLLKTCNKSHAVPKSPKSAIKSSPIQLHKQTTLKYDFNKNDKLGAISSNGHFVCPKCYVFKTINIELFRKHLLKEVNYKINLWKCLVCFEISDSPIKIARHVKKHGNGCQYEDIKDSEKSKWVDRVIGHQRNMWTELNKIRTTKHIKSVESSKTITVNNKRKFYSPTKKNNIAREKKVLISQPIPDPVSNDDIIDLVDDSDNE